MTCAHEQREKLEKQPQENYTTNATKHPKLYKQNEIYSIKHNTGNRNA
jgi:hypothetical protein